MHSKENIFRICFRGIYSCYWTSARDSKRRNACCWFSFLSLVSILTLAWIYICFIAYNDRTDLNEEAFKNLSLWVNWYMIIIILSAVLAIYCLLLLLFSLFQFLIREPLNLHWLHKVLLFFSLVIVVLGTGGISIKWKEEWSTVQLSLQATAPFLQLGAVVALTMFSWLIFQSYNRTQRAVSKVAIIVALLSVCSVIFLAPLFITSPCLIDMPLPPKPLLVGHRGAPLLAPENTMMSFRKSAECNVTAFETDVQLSKDMVPFLMHDHEKEFLKRTTNVDNVFPNRTYNTSSDITWAELRTLNAGDWFLKTDPFWSLSSLSEKDKALARNQTVPSLSDVLELAKEHNISVIFDLKNHENHCRPIVKVIQLSGIQPDLVWWLPSACRQEASAFQQVYADVAEMKYSSGNFVNVKYNAQSPKKISDLRSSNVTVNVFGVHERWLFSLMWCSGASSVTTNTCHVFKDMSQPDWYLTPHVYRVIWITADLLSLVLMFLLFLLQRRMKLRNQKSFLESERTVPLLHI